MVTSHSEQEAARRVSCFLGIDIAVFLAVGVMVVNASKLPPSLACCSSTLFYELRGVSACFRLDLNVPSLFCWEKVYENISLGVVWSRDF